MFFGQLFPIEDYRVYGSYTNTHNKIIIICDNSGSENIGIRETLVSLAAAFVNAAQNPFQDVGKPFKSKRLELSIQQIVAKHNSLVLRKR
jgi:hypothetical protein